MTARCERRGCAALMRVVTDALGRVGFVCEPCALNRAGRCRDCPAALASPAALRCRACQAQRNRDRARIRSALEYRDPKKRAKKLAQQRKYLERPEARRRRRESQRAWNAADPSMLRLARKKYRATPRGRATVRASNQRWNARHAEERRAYHRRYYLDHREALLEKQRARQRRCPTVVLAA